MENRARYTGVNFDNLRKALYLMFFGVDPIYDKDKNIVDAYSQHFDSPKYKYIIPMQGNFENPLMSDEEIVKDTFIQYWISEDRSLTQDDYTEDEEGYAVDRQKCVATVLLRFIGREAETWVRTFRHLTKRNMLKLKLQHFGHLMQRADSLEKTLMLGGIEGWASLVAQLVKNPPAMQETQVRFLGQEDPLVKG